LAHTNAEARPAILSLLATDAVADSDGNYMSRQYLAQLAEQAAELSTMVSPEQALPDWVEAKISASANALRDVHNYMKYGG
jgi:hypothetical protein